MGTDKPSMSEHQGALTRSASSPDNEPTIEFKYRRELWLNHGHEWLYGDDGEMQCSSCMKYGVWDYKRDDLEKIEKAVMLARMERAAKQLADLGKEP